MISFYLITQWEMNLDTCAKQWIFGLLSFKSIWYWITFYLVQNLIKTANSHITDTLPWLYTYPIEFVNVYVYMVTSMRTTPLLTIKLSLWPPNSYKYKANYLWFDTISNYLYLLLYIPYSGILFLLTNTFQMSMNHNLEYCRTFLVNVM